MSSTVSARNGAGRTAIPISKKKVKASPRVDNHRLKCIVPPPAGKLFFARLQIENAIVANNP
jgi:hypothetical protein